MGASEDSDDLSGRTAMDCTLHYRFVSSPPPRPREHQVLANAKTNRTHCACDVTGPPTTFRRRDAQLAGTLQLGRGNVSVQKPRCGGCALIREVLL